MWHKFCSNETYIGVFLSKWFLNLNENNRKYIWSKIQKTGDLLQPLLKPSQYHPKGRNAYAHIAICIKENFGESYKDIPDDKLEEVEEYIKFLLSNPD